MGIHATIHAATLLVTAAVTSSAYSQDLSPPDESRFGYGNYADRMEIRLGVLAYDRGFFSHTDYDGVMINGELVFRSPEFLDFLFAPRPYLGFDIALSDDPVHFFYTGLTWDFNITHRFYISGSLGGAIHTDDLIKPVGKSLGTRALFHLGLGLGFDVTENWTIQAYLDHFSNANLGPTNEGFENTGLRVGYRF